MRLLQKLARRFLHLADQFNNSAKGAILRLTFGWQRAERGELHEIESAMIFLASPLASYVTGTTVTLDGGSTAQ